VRRYNDSQRSGIANVAGKDVQSDNQSSILFQKPNIRTDVQR